MKDEVMLTETVRARLLNSEGGWGTLTGRTTELEDGSTLVEVRFDHADVPCWMNENDLDAGLSMEASIEVQHDLRSPEDAALALMSWLTSKEGPFHVHVKGDDGFSYGIEVNFNGDDGATARLRSITHLHDVGNPGRGSGVRAGSTPKWAEALISRAAEAH